MDNKKRIEDNQEEISSEDFLNGKIEVSPSLIDKDLLKNLVSSSLKKVKKIETEDNKDEADDDDDDPNYRDKDKELKESIKSQLSLEAQDAINMDDKEFNKIIEKLKQRGISSERGLKLQKIRNISKGSREIWK